MSATAREQSPICSPRAYFHQDFDEIERTIDALGNSDPRGRDAGVDERHPGEAGRVRGPITASANSNRTKCKELSMTLGEEYPELRQFFGYFGQDFDMEIPDGGDWRDVVDLFVAEWPPDSVNKIIADLDRFLAEFQTDQAINRAAGMLGNYYRPCIGHREWVIGLRSRLLAATETGG